MEGIVKIEKCIDSLECKIIYNNQNVVCRKPIMLLLPRLKENLVIHFKMITFRIYIHTHINSSVCLLVCTCACMWVCILLLICVRACNRECCVLNLFFQLIKSQTLADFWSN